MSYDENNFKKQWSQERTGDNNFFHITQKVFILQSAAIANQQQLFVIELTSWQEATITRWRSTAIHSLHIVSTRKALLQYFPQVGYVTPGKTIGGIPVTGFTVYFNITRHLFVMEQNDCMQVYFSPRGMIYISQTNHDNRGARYWHFHEKWVLIVGLRIEKDHFSKDIFSNFTPFWLKTRRNQGFNLTDF